MRKFVILALLAIASISCAQRTTVTATVADSTGSLYANCTLEIIFNGQSSASALYTLNGAVFPQDLPGQRCDSFGKFLIVLPDNLAVQPQPSQWKFSICSGQGYVAGPYCFQTLVTITGASQNISAALTAAAPILPPSGSGVINPTNGVIPVRANGTTFGDSAILATSTAFASGNASVVGKIDPVSCPIGAGSSCTGSAVGQSLSDISQIVTSTPPTNNLSATVVSGLQANPTSNVGSAQYFAGWFLTSSASSNTFSMSQLNGVLTQANHFGSGSIGNITALENGAFNNSSGLVTNVTGSLNTAQNAGTGTITTAKAGEFLSGSTNASGTITNDDTIEVDSPGIVGPLTHHKGLHIFDQTIGASNNPDPWSIYDEGGKEYFRDQISLRAPTGEQIPVSAQTSTQGYGSSLTVGTGSSAPSTKGFFGLLCTQNAWTCTNNGISGSGIADQVTSINSVTQAAGGVNLVEVGINDARVGGTTGSYQDQYRAGLLYALVSAGLPDVNKYWADNANISYVNWSGSTTVFGRNFHFTNTVGATATAVMWGTAIYVGFETQQTNNATLSVAVDGITYFPSIAQQSTNASPNSSFNWPFAVRVGGLSSSTSHTVVVTYVSGTNNSGISFIASTGGTTTTSFAAFSPIGPTTYVINAPLCCTISNQDPYNQITKQIVSELSADGLNIQLVDIASAFNGNVAGEINSGVSNHPSDLGYQIIANAIQFAMTPVAVPFDRNKFQAPGQTCTNVTPITVSANVSTDQLLMSCTLQANSLNRIGQTLHLWNSGVYTTTAANTSTLTFKIKLCTNVNCSGGTVITPLSLTSGANAGGQTNNGWNMDAWVTTTSSGATATFESHGNLAANLSGTTSSVYSDSNTSVSSAIDPEGIIFLQVTGTFSAASGSNSFTQRQLIIYPISPF